MNKKACLLLANFSIRLNSKENTLKNCEKHNLIIMTFGSETLTNGDALNNGAIENVVKDQYANGKAAKVWEVFIGDNNKRTSVYKNFLVNLLREKGCKRILDVACGTG